MGIDLPTHSRPYRVVGPLNTLNTKKMKTTFKEMTQKQLEILEIKQEGFNAIYHSISQVFDRNCLSIYKSHLRDTFRKSDLSHLNLKGLSFYGADLYQVDFTGCDLTDTDFIGACLSSAIIERKWEGSPGLTGFYNWV